MLGITGNPKQPVKDALPTDVLGGALRGSQPAVVPVMVNIEEIKA